MSTGIKVLEAVADIAYAAGLAQYYSGDSRADIKDIIEWAREFEERHKDTDWDKLDYMLEIEAYSQTKLTRLTVVY